MISKDKIFKVFGDKGIAIVEEVSPTGVALGYKTVGADGVKSEGYKSMKTLEREAKKLAKGGGVGFLRMKTLNRL